MQFEHGIVFEHFTFRRVHDAQAYLLLGEVMISDSVPRHQPFHGLCAIDHAYVRLAMLRTVY